MERRVLPQQCPSLPMTILSFQRSLIESGIRMPILNGGRGSEWSLLSSLMAG